MTLMKDPQKSQTMKLKIKVKNINVPRINEFYKPYIFQRKYKQPYIVGKIACSKDFYKSSKSKYISNKYTQSFSHLRYKIKLY